MPASIDELLDHILVANPSVNREQVLSMVEQKKTESHGLLSDEGAIRLVAQQLSISTLPGAGMTDQRIASVHPGLNNSTITGQTISVSEPRIFQRSDGSEGKVLRMRVGDSSGQITCVFWDALADMVVREALAPGSQVRLLHGYTKQGMGGEVEFHLGSRSSFQILRRSSDQFPILSPPVSDKFRAGEPLHVSVLKLQKSQSDKGPTWALCSDGSTLLIVKFWDNHARDILEVGEGATISIQNHWITERNGIVYVNVGSKSSVARMNEGLIGGTPVSSINSLKPGPSLWSISGRVVEKGEPKDIETREGRRTRVSNINLEDSTSRIRISLWDAQAKKTESLRIGDSIKLTGIKVREGMNGEIEGSTVFLTQLEKQ